MESYESRISGFYRLSMEARRQLLQKYMGLSEEDMQAFSHRSGLGDTFADTMVENAIGVFGLPLGVAVNFLVDEVPVVVPMAIEEPSVVAACSHIAKIVGVTGGFYTDVDQPIMVGQIQLLSMRDIDFSHQAVLENRQMLMDAANALCEGMVKRGGGCVDVIPRLLPALERASFDSKEPMLIVDVVIHCCDAMGANIINTVMEGVAPLVAKVAKAKVNMAILSNLADRRLAKASCAIPYRLLEEENTQDVGREVAVSIVNAYRWAMRDPYRACTHNKGVLNGIEALAIATGNDWRAISAGAHAYACRGGSYVSLTQYQLNDKKGTLEASIELPIAVGVVGGVTQSHPAAISALKLLGPFGKSSRSLARLMACVGLAQNLGALRALVCEGIQQGHMELHERKHQ